MTTYADFETAVRRTLEEASENVWLSAQILYLTNEAAIDVARRARPETHVSTTPSVAAQADYDLPGSGEVLTLTYAGKKLARMDSTSLYNASLVTGTTPVYYARNGDVVTLYPTPTNSSDDITIIRRAYPTALTTGTDEMPFSSEMNTALEYFVLKRCFEQINDIQQSSYFGAEYERAVGTAEARYLAAQSSDGAPAYPRETY